MNGHSRKPRRQHGFTILQMIITVTIITIVSTVGVLGVKTSREHFKLQNSARLFAVYIEKARADSVRRHAASGQESSVEMFGPGTNTYNVTMDFGSGTVETRTFQLDPGITFNTVAAKVTFDWRGKLRTEAVVFQIKSDYFEPIPVDVSGSGDVTIWSQFFPDQSIPAVTVSTVGDDVNHPTPYPSASTSPSPSPSPDASPTATPTATATPTPTPNNNGNGGGTNGSGGNSGNGNGNATPTPTAAPTPTPGSSPTPTPIPQCVMTLSPSSITLSQSVDALKTATTMITLTNATGIRTISTSQAGNGNSMVFGLSLTRLEGSGSSILSVTSKNGAGNRGVFLVDVTTDPACGSGAQLTVSVNN